VPGRFEIVNRDPIVAIDYAHTPDALARTASAARSLAGAGRVIVVFGAGGQRDRDKREPMGRAVGQRADIAIVTNDNPRTEDPQAIAKTLASGCRRGGRAYVAVELDRRRAIDRALSEARGGDVVVIAGKGHESGQQIGAETIPFSDAEEVRHLLGGKRGPQPSGDDGSRTASRRA
jgi:UDP-N-acetylmuramoyl-L-alanyl-D-glutamate--2,6-diaminopimelate ligase